ncbi:LysR substrate-binding domain-containing protein [Dickeya chrysanthemi]|uniref:LysR substrate-binding domain-containing protein n=1 Tax=Dickeya chrysanthemi TaxID=556 RepID=A0ABU8JRI8_DICCH|nr:LysR substrate-binding domain-containing protein [Dickeya chrysanthemi]MBX9445110.1 LysR family transcriptional regulator [Dickeya chrysanthemi]MCA7006075.1 LysR family transcriptional regulator [Dickeya chrysanthemi]
MDLTQLRMFCLVAETGSLVRAAAQLGRVPSNLTTRLRQLEQELGTDLFIRERQRVRLSPAGHNFLCYAQRILALSDEALAMAHTSEPAGLFALGAVESLLITALPELLALYHRRYPQVQLSLHNDTCGALLDAVNAGELAAGLVTGPVRHDAVNSCQVFSQQLALITAVGMPPVSQASQVKHLPLLTFAAGCGYRQRLEGWFRGQGFTPVAIVEMPSYSALLAGVAGGSGIAMVPHSVLDALPAGQQVQPHSLPGDIALVTTWLIWRRDAFGPNVEALKKLMIELGV